MCDDITSVTIPDSVTSIGNNVFRLCSNLKSVTISNSVTNIGSGNIEYDSGFAIYGTFSGCSSLTSIDIPDSVTSIDGWAFQRCTNLEKITILNPECEIYDDSSTISNGYESPEYYFNGTICGYENSTAQAYAEKYNYNFESLGEAPALELGDINNDRYIDSVDATAVLIEYAALSTSGNSTMSSAAKKSADVNGDDFIDSVDATLISSYYAAVSSGKDVTFSEFIANVKNV